jgi:hypothetical protein
MVVPIFMVGWVLSAAWVYYHGSNQKINGLRVNMRG